MYPNLKAELARKGMTMTELASKMGVTLGTLSTKMNGKYGFYYAECQEIKEILGVDIPLEELFKKAV